MPARESGGGPEAPGDPPRGVAARADRAGRWPARRPKGVARRANAPERAGGHRPVRRAVQSPPVRSGLRLRDPIVLRPADAGVALPRARLRVCAPQLSAQNHRNLRGRRALYSLRPPAASPSARRSRADSALRPPKKPSPSPANCLCPRVIRAERATFLVTLPARFCCPPSAAKGLPDATRDAFAALEMTPHRATACPAGAWVPIDLPALPQQTGGTARAPPVAGSQGTHCRPASGQPRECSLAVSFGTGVWPRWKSSREPAPARLSISPRMRR